MALPMRRQAMAVPTRWEPFERLDRQLSRLLDEISWPGFGSANTPTDISSLTPMADVEETDSGFTVEIDLAGVRKEDIAVELSGRRLVVTAEREEHEHTGTLRVQNRLSGHFRYEVGLPAEVSDEGVEAKLEDGVLTLTIPKATSEQAKRIEIL